MAKFTLRDMLAKRAGQGAKRGFRVVNDEYNVKITVTERPSDLAPTTVVNLFHNANLAKLSEGGEVGQAKTAYKEEMSGENAAYVVATMILGGNLESEDEANDLVQEALSVAGIDAADNVIVKARKRTKRPEVSAALGETNGEHS